MENKNEKSWAEREADAKKKVQAWEEKVKKAEAEFEKAIDTEYMAMLEANRQAAIYENKCANGSFDLLDERKKVEAEYPLKRAQFEHLKATLATQKAMDKSVQAGEGLRVAKQKLDSLNRVKEEYPVKLAQFEQLKATIATQKANGTGLWKGLKTK